MAPGDEQRGPSDTSGCSYSASLAECPSLADVRAGVSRRRDADGAVAVSGVRKKGLTIIKTMRVKGKTLAAGAHR